jgi:hypothetical protein
MTDLKARLCRKRERAIRRNWLRFCEGESTADPQGAVPGAKRLRSDTQCVARELHLLTMMVRILLYLAQEVWSVLHLKAVLLKLLHGACFCVSLETITNACATALSEKLSTDSHATPLCKLHYNQLYRLRLNSVTLELSIYYCACAGIATMLSALPVAL